MDNSEIFKENYIDKAKFYPSTSGCAETVIVRESIAFYNSSGGSIVWGIEKNGREFIYKGLRLDVNQKNFFKRLKKTLEEQENKYEVKIFKIRKECYEGKNIIIIDINKGNKIITLEEKVLSMDYKKMQVIEIKRSIFISHSSKDKKYGEFLVDVLLKLGLRKEQIKFSSNDEYGIENGNILNEIKGYIKQNAYMIYLVSDNYFKSPICLNEMGAAWMLNNEYQVIGVPEFDLENQLLKRSVVKTDEIAFKLDNEVRMFKFREMISKKFNLEAYKNYR